MGQMTTPNRHAKIAMIRYCSTVPLFLVVLISARPDVDLPGSRVHTTAIVEYNVQAPGRSWDTDMYRHSRNPTPPIRQKKSGASPAAQTRCLSASKALFLNLIAMVLVVGMTRDGCA